MGEHSAEYDGFAAVYNRHWGRDYHALAFPVVSSLLLSRLPSNASILDVCCGTGHFTARIHQEGFRTAGIDASSNMLAYARQNAPGIPFTLADVRSFSLQCKFDAAYSIFESLNHLPDLAALEVAFLNIRRHLKRGAPFLFDLNREEAFVAQWNEVNAIVDPDCVCATRSAYDETTRVATCEVTLFNLVQGAWNRSDLVLRQTCHNLDAVHSLLLKTGFGAIVLYDAADGGMDEHTAYARTFFLAKAS